MVLTLLALSATLVSLTFAMVSLDTAQKARLNRAEMERAKVAAQSGVQYALAQLAATQINSTNQDTSDTKVVTSKSDTWATLGDRGQEEFSLGDSSFRLEIIDASSKVDLNTAPTEQLSRLPLTAEQADSILDYIQTGTDARQNGAKDQYYNGLTVPYNTKLGRLASVDELLQVKGFTAQNLYGVTSQSPQDGNVSPSAGLALADLFETETRNREVKADGTNKTSIRQVTVQELTRQGIPQAAATAIFNQRTTAQSMRQLLQAQGMTVRAAVTLLDNYTIDGQATHEGRLNANTASLDALQSIPNLAADLASTINTRQSTPFNNWNDLSQVSGIDLAALQNLADRLSFTSTTFTVRCIGKAGDFTYCLEALVKTDGTEPVVVRLTQPPFDDMDRRWNWADPTRTTNLGSQQ